MRDAACDPRTHRATGARFQSVAYNVDAEAIDGTRRLALATVEIVIEQQDGTA